MSVTRYYKQASGEAPRASHWSKWPFPPENEFHVYDRFRGDGSGWFCFFVVRVNESAVNGQQFYLGKRNLFEKQLTTMEVVESGDKDRPYKALFDMGESK